MRKVFDIKIYKVGVKDVVDSKLEILYHPLEGEPKHIEPTSNYYPINKVFHNVEITKKIKLITEEDEWGNYEIILKTPTIEIPVGYFYGSMGSNKIPLHPNKKTIEELEEFLREIEEKYAELEKEFTRIETITLTLGGCKK